MVREENSIVWRCPYCDKTYDDEDDALECANECADVDSPIEDEETRYFCEICEEEFEEEFEAIECENKHEKNNDWTYQEHIRRKEEKRMLEVANHPAQSRLNKFGIKPW